ncbi:YgiQ family radical SAM protein [Anoxybacter fermentans]|uniref:YgiQ family radical SAM protein n=1 Tax=Anoxybacter fermentans TaxID=1323375 RepID=A0A3Q9HP55_9FIRM|nr:YgiQ family radical SAM protein [Anoxybacter fermentans]AZR72410.1 YgiQ family radical SAM protein [Anoxybacter fermentans]
MKKKREDFLPINAEDMKARGWDQLDILLITGDAYVDHPSFGVAIIGRLLEIHGYKVGIIAQPDWRDIKDFKAFGDKPPRLFVGITSGNLDSMVNNYTAARRRRKRDVYSPGGVGGKRPDRAVIVYANRVREVFGKVPIVIGGLEASLRRFAHYDYWQDRVRRSILLDSRADLIVYGMGERQVVEIAQSLESGIPIEYLTYLDGTVAKTKSLDGLKDFVELPSYEEVSTDKEKYALSFKLQYQEQDPFKGRPVVQKHGDWYIVQNRPAKPLATHELDRLYELPYTREYHPIYEKEGGIPALKEVKFSIVTHRGCYGSCAFCALVQHQGRIIQSRSKESILKEVRLLTKLPDFKGVIHDVGGPTANMYKTGCSRDGEGYCGKRNCLFPSPCPNLKKSHQEYIDLLRSIRQIPGVKHVFIRSGIRYDLLMADNESDFLKELCEHHVSGQLKIAPEHVSPKVLKAMRKPSFEVYAKFREEYKKVNKMLGKKQYLVPYFISSHPGCGLDEMIQLAEHIRDLKYNPEQVQDFTPTPMTLATCMYYTGIDPLTGEKIYVPKDMGEKRMQRALLQFRDPKNYDLVKKALKKAGRDDLIGSGKKALIPDRRPGAHRRKGQRRKKKC